MLRETSFGLSSAVPDAVRRPITLERKLMTVIVALDCGDSLLFGADSLVTDSQHDLKTVQQKVLILPQGPLVCGFAGDDGVGLAFRRWLMSQQWPAATTWETLGDISATELSRLNGRRRERAKLAGVELKPEDTSSVLLAGFVGGQFDIWELDDSGGADSVKHRGFVGIGSGFPHAFIGYTALTRYTSFDRDLAVYVGVEMAAILCTKCGPPIRLLRVNKDGVSDLAVKNGKLVEAPARGSDGSG